MTVTSTNSRAQYFAAAEKVLSDNPETKAQGVLEIREFIQDDPEFAQTYFTALISRGIRTTEMFGRKNGRTSQITVEANLDEEQIAYLSIGVSLLPHSYDDPTNFYEKSLNDILNVLNIKCLKDVVKDLAINGQLVENF